MNVHDVRATRLRNRNNPTHRLCRPNRTGGEFEHGFPINRRPPLFYAMAPFTKKSYLVSHDPIFT